MNTKPSQHRSSSCAFCVRTYPTVEAERLDDDVFVLTPHYVGKHILLCGKKSTHFPYHLMVGPDWPCMLLTYALICVPTFFFCFNIGAVLGWWLYVVGGFTGCMTLLFYSLTACSDPGIVYTKAMPSLERMESLARAQEGRPSDGGTSSGTSSNSRRLCDIEEGGSVAVTLTGETTSADLCSANSAAAGAGVGVGVGVGVGGGNDHGKVQQITGNNTGDQGIEDSLDKSNIDISVSLDDNNNNNNNNSCPPSRRATSDQDTTFNSDCSSGDIENNNTTTINANNDNSSNSNNNPSRAVAVITKKVVANNNNNHHPHPHFIDCGSCAMKRPTTASHCYDCGLCIDEVDHHCPWSGKCIAKKNIKSFYCFLWCLSFHIIFVLVVTIYAILQGFAIFSTPHSK